jgi:hypothetical protein
MFTIVLSQRTCSRVSRRKPVICSKLYARNSDAAVKIYAYDQQTRTGQSTRDGKITIRSIAVTQPAGTVRKYRFTSVHRRIRAHMTRWRALYYGDEREVIAETSNLYGNRRIRKCSFSLAQSVLTFLWCLKQNLNIFVVSWYVSVVIFARESKKHSYNCEQVEKGSLSSVTDHNSAKSVKTIERWFPS